MRTLFQDARYAVRRLRRSTGFTVTVMLTIALGVGAVTAVFSVVHGVLLRPYAFRDPGQIVVWRESIREMEQVSPALPDNYRHYLNLKDHAHSIQDAAILQTAGFSVATGVDHPRMAEGLSVSPNFFSVLGVAPLLGRAFVPGEAQIGRDKEIILTWAAWQRLYHGDSAVLGKTLRVGGEPETIVGVLPKSFRFPVMSVMPGQASYGSTERYELFKPLVPTTSELTANDAEFNFVVVARLKPGVSVQQAQGELDGIEKATAAADHLAIHLSVIVEPFAQEITGAISKPLWLLFAAVAGVLLMACVNLANLQIARGVARDHETALRSALGAGRGRLLQSVLVENLILGLGEERAEITEALADLRSAGCELLTITQYLRPTPRHHPVERWVKPEEFVELREEAMELGFAGVMSGPLVRSSYRAGRLYAQAIEQRADGAALASG